jgi:hypothetical protein
LELGRFHAVDVNRGDGDRGLALWRSGYDVLGCCCDAIDLINLLRGVDVSSIGVIVRGIILWRVFFGRLVLWYAFWQGWWYLAIDLMLP